MTRDAGEGGAGVVGAAKLGQQQDPMGQDVGGKLRQPSDHHVEGGEGSGEIAGGDGGFGDDGSGAGAAPIVIAGACGLGLRAQGWELSWGRGPDRFNGPAGENQLAWGRGYHRRGGAREGHHQHGDNDQRRDARLGPPRRMPKAPHAEATDVTGR